MADSDEIKLHPDTLKALLEHFEEQRKINEQLQGATEETATQVAIEENWQLSQFWYDEETANKFADEALSNSIDNNIVCVSTPTIFRAIMKKENIIRDHVYLLEYDTRFQIHGEHFIFYDYKQPLELPENLKNRFNYVILDPPFLSEECFCKASETALFLAAKNAKIVVNTGAILTGLIYNKLGLKECEFRPHHARNLSNEFRCFSNYESNLFKHLK